MKNPVFKGGGGGGLVYEKPIYRGELPNKGGGGGWGGRRFAGLRKRGGLRWREGGLIPQCTL